MGKKYKKVKIEGLYSLDDGYIPFPDNEHHGKEFENVPVAIEKQINKICGISVEVDVIRIGENNELEIECELVNKKILKDGTLILQICQDWG